MKVHQFEDAIHFYERVKDYLLRQEAGNNVLLGIIKILIEDPERFREKPYLATVEQDNNIVAVAIITPPNPLIISLVENFQAVQILAQHLSISGQKISGVNAPINESQAFVLAWHSLTNQVYELKMSLRAFQLEKVQFISPSTGYLRQAIETDRELLKNWHKAFSLEALGGIETDIERWVERVLKQGTAYIWQDEVPVSIACRVGLTPNGARIGMVYTPPEYRRLGYAGACVATLSQTLLNQGNRFCFLFTDLANPTSNHIYQQIGYQSVGDWQQYSFVEQ